MFNKINPKQRKIIPPTALYVFKMASKTEAIRGFRSASRGCSVLSI